MQKPHTLEHTAYIASKEAVFHYTCNSPALDVLQKYGIKSIGDNFKCENPAEILLIPEKVYRKAGYDVKNMDSESLKITSENLLSRLV